MINADFFERNPVLAARELLGAYLVRKIDGKTVRLKIVETEAYGGREDLGSHARRGQTPGNSPMFERAGTIYVYFTYGMHWMLNIVCREKGNPGAILIRGVEGCIGPGRLTKKLGIDKRLNGLRIGKRSGLWIEENPEKNFKIKKTPRIGIAYAGPIWANKKHRFVLE